MVTILTIISFDNTALVETGKERIVRETQLHLQKGS
jgi:hypothetical protein